MKKGKRLLFILLAAMLMVFGAVCSSFAHDGTYHKWNMTKSTDNIAELQCNDNACPYDYYSPVQITLIADDSVYDGKEYKSARIDYPWATTSAASDHGVTIPNKITYTDRSGKEINGTPVDAGEYVAKIDIQAIYYEGYNDGQWVTHTSTVTLTKEFVIAKQPIAVVAKDNEISYGEKPAASDGLDGLAFYTIDPATGKKDDEITDEDRTAVESDLTGTLQYTFDYKQFDDANYLNGDYIAGKQKYKITPSGINSKNYDIRFFEAGELKVYPKVVSIDWVDRCNGKDKAITSEGVYSVTFNGKYHELIPTVSKDSYAKNSDGSSHDAEITLTKTGDLKEKDANTSADNYVAKVTELSNSNYTLVADPKSTGTGSDTFVDSAKKEWRINALVAELSWKYGTGAGSDGVAAEYNGDKQYNVATVANAIQDNPVEVTEYNHPEAKNVGEYVTTATKLDNPNYILSSEESENQKTWKIKPAPLTVAVKNGGWVTYGDDVSELKDYKTDSDGVAYEFTGFVGGETESVVSGTPTYKFVDYAQYGDADTTGNIYKVTLSDGLVADNYEITYVPGPLYVYQKPVELEWFNEDGTSEVAPYTYDGDYHKVVAKVKSDGIVNKDKVEVEIYTGDDEKIDSCKKAKVDKYTVKATELDNPNYTLLTDPKHDEETTTGTDTQDWKILQRKAEFKWFNDETGEEIVKSDGVSPEATFVYNGKSREIRAEVANPQHRADTDKDDTVKVKKYDGNGAKDSNAKASTPYQAVVESLNDDNYTLEGATRKEQRYWIDPLPIELKWKYGSTVYNGKEQTNVAKITNLVLGDDEKEAALTYDGDYTKRDVGHYTAKVKEVADKNYTVEGAKGLEGPWDITKATVAVKANNNEISYGDDPKDAGYKVSGLKGGDKINIRTVSYTYDYKKYGKPGYYKINPVVDAEANPNYDFVYEYGVLTVKDKVTTLKAKAKAKTTAGKISWNKVAGAKKYQVFIAQCNTKTQKFKIKKVKTVKAPLKSCTVRKLKRNTFYKFYVVALDGSGKKIAQTKTNHFCTGNSCGNLTNPKTIKASKHSVSVKAGGKYKLSAKVTKVRSDKKLATAKNHTNKVRYISEVPKVAKVDKNGKITGVSAGWCRIYVVGVNGIWDTIEVNVK